MVFRRADRPGVPDFWDLHSPLADVFFELSGNSPYCADVFPALRRSRSNSPMAPGPISHTNSISQSMAWIGFVANFIVFVNTRRVLIARRMFFIAIFATPAPLQEGRCVTHRPRILRAVGMSLYYVVVTVVRRFAARSRYFSRLLHTRSTTS